MDRVSHGTVSYSHMHGYRERESEAWKGQIERQSHGRATAMHIDTVKE